MSGTTYTCNCLIQDIVNLSTKECQMSTDQRHTDFSHFELNLYYLSGLAERRPGREDKSMGEYEQSVSDICQNAMPANKSDAYTHRSSLHRLTPLSNLPKPRAPISKLRSGLSVSYRFPLVFIIMDFLKRLGNSILNVSRNLKTRRGIDNKNNNLAASSGIINSISDSLQIRTYS